MSFFTKREVLEFLPHREPFLFIDTVEQVTIPEGLCLSSLGLNDFQPLIGGRVHARFYVHEELSCFQGHFPGNPIFPGVLQVEMMAQASAFLMSSNRQYKTVGTKMDVAFLKADHIRFRQKIVPPMTLDIRTELLKVRGPICSFSAEIFFEETLMSEGEILASLKFKG